MRNAVASWAAVVPMLVVFSLGCQSTAVPQGGSEISLVVTRVPVGTASEEPAWVPPDRRYPAGSQVVLVTTGQNPSAVRILSRRLWAAGAPAVSFDGRRAVFAGKAAAEDHWSIYDVNLRGSRLRKLADLGRDCSDPAYLSDDRVVFSCANSDDPEASWSLHVGGVSAPAQRITFAPGRAVTPTVLQDGRILFSLAMPQDETQTTPSGFALFTINPDGTLLDSFTDGHRPGPAELRPRLTQDGGVLFVSVQGGSTFRRAERAELAYPRNRRADVRLPASPTGELRPGSVEAHPQDGLLVTARNARATTGSWGVFHVGSGDGPAQGLLDSPDWDEIEAIPVAVNRLPRRRPSSLKPEMTTGTVVCYDASLSDHRPPAGELRRRPVRVHVEVHGSPEAVPAIDAPVHDDGSFLLELPADRALRIRTLDDQTQLIATSGWFWLRPGEVRACFGCHEDRRSAPRNRPVQALAAVTGP